MAYTRADHALLFDAQMITTFLAERGNDEARLVLNRATSRALNLDLALGELRSVWFPEA